MTHHEQLYTKDLADGAARFTGEQSENGVYAEVQEMRSEQLQQQVEEAEKGLMQRLAEKTKTMPGLKEFLVILPLLGNASQAEAGSLWGDIGGIVKDVVTETVGGEVRHKTSEVRYGVYDSIYKQCSGIHDAQMQRMCDEIARRSMDRVLQSVTSR